MLLSKLLLAAIAAASAAADENPPPRTGAIGGAVLNAADKQPVAGAEVVLRVKLEDSFVPLAETRTDARGRFAFDRLFVGPHYEYLPGANRDGVHYPGPLVRLSAARPTSTVVLEVCDAVSGPNPLVIRRQDILVRTEAGAVSVTESLVIDNPTSTCYVGAPTPEGGDPVTLELAIPPDFERVTFHKEFFGRRFAVGRGKLTTGIPWTPGKREVTFTYVLPSDRPYRLWQRPLDLPCHELRLCVETDRPDHVSCNLPKGAADRGKVVFEAKGEVLPAGHVVRLEMGRLPVPWMTYGRWLAAGTLGAFLAGTTVVLLRRRRSGGPQADSPAPAEGQPSFARGSGRRAKRRGRKPDAPPRRAA